MMLVTVRMVGTTTVEASDTTSTFVGTDFMTEKTQGQRKTVAIIQQSLTFLKKLNETDLCGTSNFENRICLEQSPTLQAEWSISSLLSLQEIGKGDLLLRALHNWLFGCLDSHKVAGSTLTGQNKTNRFVPALAPG